MPRTCSIVAVSSRYGRLPRVVAYIKGEATSAVRRISLNNELPGRCDFFTLRRYGPVDHEWRVVVTALVDTRLTFDEAIEGFFAKGAGEHA